MANDFGFGLGVVSHINGIRMKNTENLEDYLNGKYYIDFEELTQAQKIAENIMLWITAY